MNDTHFKSAQNLFFLKDTVEILSIPPSIFFGCYSFCLHSAVKIVKSVKGLNLGYQILVWLLASLMSGAVCPFPKFRFHLFLYNVF